MILPPPGFCQPTDPDEVRREADRQREEHREVRRRVASALLDRVWEGLRDAEP